MHASCRAGLFARGQGGEEWRLIAAKQFHAAHRSFINGCETGKVCKRFPLGPTFCVKILRLSRVNDVRALERVMRIARFIDMALTRVAAGAGVIPPRLFNASE